MKETPVSNVEKSFIYEAISKAKRTDGRHLDERRNVEIHFGHEFGSCIGLQNILNLLTCSWHQKTKPRIQSTAKRPVSLLIPMYEGVLLILIHYFKRHFILKAFKKHFVAV